MRPFDLEKRTTEFAKAVIRTCKSLPFSPINSRLIEQAVGSSGSVGANYREANDSLGKKDLVQRMKIARRESKESCHWLELLAEANRAHKDELMTLLKEATEIKDILSAIINPGFCISKIRGNPNFALNKIVQRKIRDYPAKIVIIPDEINFAGPSGKFCLPKADKIWVNKLE